MSLEPVLNGRLGRGVVVFGSESDAEQYRAARAECLERVPPSLQSLVGIFRDGRYVVLNVPATDQEVGAALWDDASRWAMENAAEVAQVQWTRDHAAVARRAE